MDDEAQRRVGSRVRHACRPAVSCRERSGDSRADRSSCRARSPDVATDNPVFVPPFLGARVVKGIAARRHRRVRQRDGAVPQPVAVPPREAADGKPEPTTSSRPASARSSASSSPPPRRPACSCRRSSTGTSPPTATATTSSCGPTRSRTTEAARFHYPRQKVAPFLCIADFFRPIESGSSSTTPPSTSSRWAPRSARRRPSCSPTTSTSSTCCCTASASRWPRRWPSVAPPHPRGVGLRRRGRSDDRRPVPPAVPRRALLVGLPGVPGPRGQRHRRPAARGRPPRHRGVSEETGWQYQPEQTTSAIICHHPQAKYFVAR